MNEREQGKRNKAFIPLGMMMITEEMYKANFILDRWLKRGTNSDEGAAQPQNGLEAGANSNHDAKREDISSKSSTDNKGQDEDRIDEEGEDNDDDDDDNFNGRSDDNDDNNDDNDGGVMMPIPDVSF